GTGGGQSVNFNSGYFPAINVSDGTIPDVSFSGGISVFAGDVNILASKSLGQAQAAAISAAGAINLVAGGTNAGLAVNADVRSTVGPVKLQATGDLTIGDGVT